MKFDPTKHIVVAVTFNSSNKPTQYEYFLPKDIDVSQGDTCIVNSPYDGLTTVTVRSIRTTPRGVDPTRLKPIIDIVNVNLLVENRDSANCLHGIAVELKRLQKIAGSANMRVAEASVSPVVAVDTSTESGDPF